MRATWEPLRERELLVLVLVREWWSWGGWGLGSRSGSHRRWAFSAGELERFASQGESRTESRESSAKTVCLG